MEINQGNKNLSLRIFQAALPQVKYIYTYVLYFCVNVELLLANNSNYWLKVT